MKGLTDEEREEGRVGRLEEALERVDMEDYAPGTFGCHEAVTLIRLLEDTIARQVLEHPAIVQNPAWYKLADQAWESLYELHGAIENEHCD